MSNIKREDLRKIQARQEVSYMAQQFVATMVFAIVVFGFMFLIMFL